jgi:hypothetical protein
VQALAGEKRANVGRVARGGTFTSRQALHLQIVKVKQRKLFKGLWKDKTRLLRASENARF